MRLHRNLFIIVAAASGCASMNTAGSTARPGADPESEPLRIGSAQAPPSQPSRPERSEGAKAKPEERKVACPTDLPDTTVMVTQLDDGVALLFVTPRDQYVVPLRKRVRALALTQNYGAHLAPDTAVGNLAPLDEEPHEPTATVEDVDEGALLKFTPSSSTS